MAFSWPVHQKQLGLIEPGISLTQGRNQFLFLKKIKKKKHHTIALVENGMAKILRCLIDEMLGSVFVVSLILSFPGLPRWGILSDMHCGCCIAISEFYFILCRRSPCVCI